MKLSDMDKAQCHRAWTDGYHFGWLQLTTGDFLEGPFKLDPNYVKDEVVFRQIPQGPRRDVYEGLIVPFASVRMAYRGFQPVPNVLEQLGGAA